MAKRPVFDDILVEAGFWYVDAIARGTDIIGVDDHVHVDPSSCTGTFPSKGLGSLGAEELADHLLPMLAPYRLNRDQAVRIAVDVIDIRTRSYVRHDARPISAVVFERTRGRIIKKWGAVSSKGVTLWPPASRTVATRLGGGDWNRTLQNLGIPLSRLGRAKGLTSFSEEDFTVAIREFVSHCKTEGRNPSFAAYQKWELRCRDQGIRRPAQATMRLHYGTWSAAIDAARKALEG